MFDFHSLMEHSDQQCQHLVCYTITYHISQFVFQYFFNLMIKDVVKPRCTSVELDFQTAYVAATGCGVDGGAAIFIHTLGDYKLLWLYLWIWGEAPKKQ